MSTREEWVSRLQGALGSRPVRWAPSELTHGDYEGRGRTLEVFNADAHEQLGLLKQLSPHRPLLEADVGGPVVVIFHTRKESAARYAPFVQRAMLELEEASLSA